MKKLLRGTDDMCFCSELRDWFAGLLRWITWEKLVLGSTEWCAAGVICPLLVKEAKLRWEGRAVLRVQTSRGKVKKRSLSTVASGEEPGWKICLPHHFQSSAAAICNFLFSDSSGWKLMAALRKTVLSWHDKQGFLKLGLEGMRSIKWEWRRGEERREAARAEMKPLGGRGRCELAGHLWDPDPLSQDMGTLAPKENRGLGLVSKAGSLKSTCPLFPLTASS